MWTKEALQALIEEKLRGYRFILVSNREPYLHRYGSDQIECIQPASGLAIALEPMMRASGGVWIAHGSGDADRATVDACNHVSVPLQEPRFTLRRVWLTEEQERLYYDGLANQGLWPLCHICSPGRLSIPTNGELIGKSTKFLRARSWKRLATGPRSFSFRTITSGCYPG